MNLPELLQPWVMPACLVSSLFLLSYAQHRLTTAKRHREAARRMAAALDTQTAPGCPPWTAAALGRAAEVPEGIAQTYLRGAYLSGACTMALEETAEACEVVYTFPPGMPSPPTEERSPYA